MKKSFIRFRRTPETEILAKSSAQKKMWNYLEDILQESGLHRAIKTLRKKYKIPASGFKTEDYSYLHEGKTFIGLPDHLFNNLPFNREAKELGRKYGIIWSDVFKSFVIYNKLHETYSSMFFVVDLNEELNGPFRFEEEKDMTLTTMKDVIKIYPIALLINPYVSQRDVIDYVKRLYKLRIKPLQEKYRKKNIKIGRVRKKSTTVRSRNRLIYENRGLPIKKIQSLVADEFRQVLDYTYIHKIITTEEKRRK